MSEPSMHTHEYPVHSVAPLLEAIPSLAEPTLRHRIIAIRTEEVCGIQEYRLEFAPTLGATSEVELVWYRTSLGRPQPLTDRLVLPRGGVSVVFPLSGHSVDEPYVISSLTRPVIVELSGTQETIGIQLKPLGFDRFFRFHAEELEDHYVFMLHDTDSRLTELTAPLYDTGSIPEKLGVVDRILDRFTKPEIHPAVHRALAAIASQRGNLRVERLCQTCGLSQRQLQRAFLRSVGVTPYRYAKVIRFLNACNSLIASRGEFGDLDWSLGYSDQSHLCREVKRYSRHTPIGLARNTPALFHGRPLRRFSTFPVQDPHTLL